MLSYPLVGGDESGEAVGLRLRDDEAVEGVPRPALIQSSFNNQREEEVAYLHIQFMANFAHHVPR